MSTKTLSEIWVYPVKSLPGIRLKTANVFNKGLENDRRFMLIDAQGNFMTQRVYPQMTFFDVSLDNQVIRVRSKTNERLGTLFVKPPVSESPSFKTLIWDAEVNVVEVNPSFSKWFSEALKVNCKLVFFPEKNDRRVDPEYVKQEHHVSLADGYPFLIIGKPSLRDLNQKAGVEFSMTRFRPNFVFEGGEPYEEDEWANFGIGPIRFAGVKPCGRCVLITVDPDTGIKGEEPLRTLASYRRKKGKVCFGENVIPLNEGEIKEGDEIHLL
jgi:uncharacterized protein YcbX